MRCHWLLPQSLLPGNPENERTPSEHRKNGASVPNLGIKIIRGIGLTGILFLLTTWLIGAVLNVRGISNDLDFIMRNTFFYDLIWTPEAVSVAAVKIGLQANTFPWFWLIIEISMVTTFATAGLIIFLRKKDLFGTYLGISLVLIGTSITGPVISIVSSAVPEAQQFLLLLSSAGFLAFASLLYVFPDGRSVLVKMVGAISGEDHSTRASQSVDAFGREPMVEHIFSRK